MKRALRNRAFTDFGESGFSVQATGLILHRIKPCVEGKLMSGLKFLAGQLGQNLGCRTPGDTRNGAQ
jgi:hypothetical protein